MAMYRLAQRSPGAAVGRRRTAASVRRRAMVAAVALAAPLSLAAPAIATPAVAAPAAHATDKTPVLLVHGFDVTLAVSTPTGPLVAAWVPAVVATGVIACEVDRDDREPPVEAAWQTAVEQA